MTNAGGNIISGGEPMAVIAPHLDRNIHQHLEWKQIIGDTRFQTKAEGYKFHK